jgi:hypothetical protein
VQPIIHRAAPQIAEPPARLSKDIPRTHQCAFAPESEEGILKPVLNLNVIAHVRDMEDSGKRWPLGSHSE